MGSNWYVLRTEPRAEYMATREMDRDGFEVFFPCVEAAHSRFGHADTPLFPGYLFLRCDKFSPCRCLGDRALLPASIPLPEVMA